MRLGNARAVWALWPTIAQTLGHHCLFLLPAWCSTGFLGRYHPGSPVGQDRAPLGRDCDVSVRTFPGEVKVEYDLPSSQGQ